MDYKSVDLDRYNNAMNDVIDSLKKMHASCPDLDGAAISITSRLKDENSIHNKLIKKNLCCDVDPSTVIHDIAGVRCIFSYDKHKDDVLILESYIDEKVNELNLESDVTMFFEKLKRELIFIFESYGRPEFKNNCDFSLIYKYLMFFENNSDFKIVKYKDYFENPKESGYRGYHIVVQIDGVEVEIQFRTFLQHIWSQLEHKFIYKCRSLGLDEVPKEFREFFKMASSVIDEMSHPYSVDYSKDGIHFNK